MSDMTMLVPVVLRCRNCGAEFERAYELSLDGAALDVRRFLRGRETSKIRYSLRGAAREAGWIVNNSGVLCPACSDSEQAVDALLDSAAMHSPIALFDAVMARRRHQKAQESSISEEGEDDAVS